MNLQLSKILKKSTQLQFFFWIILIVLCVFFEYSGMTPALRFNRHLIEAGQWYRLITANFVHLNDVHLMMNMLGVVVVMFFFTGYLKLLQWGSLILLSSLIVGLGLLLFNPEVKNYVGLSGVLHALFIVGAVTEIRRFPLSGWLLFIALIIKLVWEQLNGAMPGSESFIKGNVLVDSHLYGAVAGLIFLIFIFGFKKLRKMLF